MLAPASPSASTMAANHFAKESRASKMHNSLMKPQGSGWKFQKYSKPATTQTKMVPEHNERSWCLFCWFRRLIIFIVDVYFFVLSSNEKKKEKRWGIGKKQVDTLPETNSKHPWKSVKSRSSWNHPFSGANCCCYFQALEGKEVNLYKFLGISGFWSLWTSLWIFKYQVWWNT